jgi:hypothetical protein
MDILMLCVLGACALATVALLGLCAPPEDSSWTP